MVALGVLLALCAIPAAVLLGGNSGANLTADRGAEILRRAADKLGSLRSYHFRLSGARGTSASILYDLDIVADDGASGQITIDGLTAAVIQKNGRTYLRGEAFVALEYGQQAGETAGPDWVQVTPETPPDLQLELLSSTRLFVRCLKAQHGTVTVDGEGKTDGRVTWKLHDHGDRPGTTPEVAYVSSDGTYDLIRIERTGPRTPGPNDPSCGVVDPDQNAQLLAHLEFSEFNEPVHVFSPDTTKILPSTIRSPPPSPIA
jgi:hypothetical protein